MDDYTFIKLDFARLRFRQDYADDLVFEVDSASGHFGSDKVDMSFPDLNDPDDLVNGVTLRINRSYSGMDAELAGRFGQMMVYLAGIAEACNAANAGAIEEARRKQAEAEAERERQRVEREQLIAERKERLMYEFADADVKVRTAGYKTTVRAKVVVHAVRGEYDYETHSYKETGEYEPKIEYHYDNDWNRPKNVERIRRLEVKVGSRYKVVWDDGDEDLPYYDRAVRADKRQHVQAYSGAE